MSLFRTAPTDGLGAAFADALRAVRRRFFLFGALIVTLLTVDLILFLVTGLPSPAGALAALLTVAVTTRSVVEGRDVSIRETISGLRAMMPAIARTIGGGALVGLPLLLVIGTAMAIDPAARTTVALAVDRPLFGAIAWLTAVMAAPFASLPAQAVLYVGGGVVSAEASAELKAFAEKVNVPVATTLMGVGTFPETHPLSMHWFGMHGAAYGNWAVDQCDLLLCFAARFDDRITGNTDKFAVSAKIVHIDIDASEHNKNKRVQLAITSDIKYALTRLNELAAKFTPPDNQPWHAQIATWMKDHPFGYEESKHIVPQEAVKVLYELTKGDAIITTGVGQHQMWAAQFYRFNEPRRYISSLGLGAMGFGYPAALGAKVARPDKQVIDIDGDGSWVMNIQELATAHIEKIAAKAMILNNQHLGMVVQWEDRFYGSVRGNTILGDESNVGSPDNLAGIYPDFVTIAQGFGVKARRVHKKSELREAIQEMLDHDGPYVLDVIVPYTEHVLPMIPAGKTVKDMLLK